MDTISSNKNVPLLNFAFLHLDTKRVLGAGGSARVYRGEYSPCLLAITAPRSILLRCLRLSLARLLESYD